MHHSCSILLYFKCVRRRRSYDRHPDPNLQQVLEDNRRMADHMDLIPSYHTPKERQLAAVTELQNHQSALSTILVRSCWRSSSTDSSHTQKRSLQNSKLVSEPKGAPQNKYLISGSCAKNNCSISRISTMSSQTSRRHLTGYGTKLYGQPWGNTASASTSYESLKICMTRHKSAVLFNGST